MGMFYKHWRKRSDKRPANTSELQEAIFQNRKFEPVDKLEYGDHGLHAAAELILDAIKKGKKIALYADYDVDGTMSCVSWLWFLKAIGHDKVLHHIPCRFSEGYGLNMQAIKKLIHEDGAELIITMDTGITANAEAEYCKSQNVDFICTDHHKIQPEKMPDCVILNPKTNPDPIYQELCGCGITFVLLRFLGKQFQVDPVLWKDLLALCGIATICDLVSLNGVNHRLARMGVQALTKSKNPLFTKLKEACAIDLGKKGLDESDIGFRLGPRINAVGRLEHADLIIEAFVGENPDPLIEKMSQLNEKRKSIQKKIVEEATVLAEFDQDDPVLFLGGDWHQGVVGIAASRIAETYWRPTWLFQVGEDICKGSARSVPGFDVTAAMSSVAHLFEKFGGHTAAGGFSFKPSNLEAIKEGLMAYALEVYDEKPNIWESTIEFDCGLDPRLVSLQGAKSLSFLQPYGMDFRKPTFCVDATIDEVKFYKDKETGEPRHTAFHVKLGNGRKERVVFFNRVIEGELAQKSAAFVVEMEVSHFRGRPECSLYGKDLRIDGH